MFTKLSDIYLNHIKKNPYVYSILLIVFVMGIIAGYMGIHGLYGDYKKELSYYIKGFMKIFDIKKVDNLTLFKVSLYREIKGLLLVWFFGVCIIGIPGIFTAVLLRGFTIGFTFGVIIESLGKKGILMILAIILFKEIMLLIIFMVVSANGIIFSSDIIKSFTAKNIKLENVKTKLVNYCIFGLKQLLLVIFPVCIEAVFLPVFIKI